MKAVNQNIYFMIVYDLKVYISPYKDLKDKTRLPYRLIKLKIKREEFEGKDKVNDF